MEELYNVLDRVDIDLIGMREFLEMELINGTVSINLLQENLSLKGKRIKKTGIFVNMQRLFLKTVVLMNNGKFLNIFKVV
jgi:hypothetical protein